MKYAWGIYEPEASGWEKYYTEFMPLQADFPKFHWPLGEAVRRLAKNLGNWFPCIRSNMIDIINKKGLAILMKLTCQGSPHISVGKGETFFLIFTTRKLSRPQNLKRLSMTHHRMRNIGWVILFALNTWLNGGLIASAGSAQKYRIITIREDSWEPLETFQNYP